MTDTKKKSCRNPSGIPPLAFDSGEKGDSNGEVNNGSTDDASEGVGKNTIPSNANNRDPPGKEKAPSQPSTDNVETNGNVKDTEMDHHGPATSLEAPSQEATTDKLPPRVDENTTRGVSLNVVSSQSNNESSTTPLSEPEEGSSTNSSPQKRPMPPSNIIKAALQEEVQQHYSNHDAPEMVPEQEQEETPPVFSEDEKKSDERTDADLMPQPRTTQAMPPRSVSEQQEPPVIQQLAHSHSGLSSFPDPAFHMQHAQQMAMLGYAAMAAPPPPPFVAPGGRRKITLRLQEDAPPTGPQSHARRPSFFFRQSITAQEEQHTTSIDRGSIAVSWFEGTTSAELQEHVRKSLIRKMGLKSGNVKLHDLRIIDESMDPPEEIVLSPFIPDGSHFLLRFSTKSKPEMTMRRGNFASRYLENQIASTAPDSPSAAPISPHISSSNLLNLNEEQLATLQAKLKGLDVSSSEKQQAHKKQEQQPSGSFSLDDSEPSPLKKVSKSGEDASRGSTAELNEEDVMMMDPDDQIEARMRQLTDLLINERRGKRARGPSERRQEKKQVIFVMANYFVLFLSVIAIMAEIQSRAPRWLEWAERNLESVQSCATDQESLFHCVSNGDFSGLMAAIILWFGRSAATRRLFLFGFETPKKLWTVVYEAMVTAFCWGISYTFIRRGLNPDTRQNFISKYWKDAVYGSLAGFNASFLKAVLKNLIPQEALEDALQERHIKILSFLPSFH